MDNFKQTLLSTIINPNEETAKLVYSLPDVIEKESFYSDIILYAKLYRYSVEHLKKAFKEISRLPGSLYKTNGIGWMCSEIIRNRYKVMTHKNASIYFSELAKIFFAFNLKKTKLYDSCGNGEKDFKNVITSMSFNYIDFSIPKSGDPRENFGELKINTSPFADCPSTYIPPTASNEFYLLANYLEHGEILRIIYLNFLLAGNHI